jgi:hypothetical protein
MKTKTSAKSTKTQETHRCDLGRLCRTTKKTSVEGLEKLMCVDCNRQIHVCCGYKSPWNGFKVSCHAAEDCHTNSQKLTQNKPRASKNTISSSATPSLQRNKKQSKMKNNTMSTSSLPLGTDKKQNSSQKKPRTSSSSAPPSKRGRDNKKKSERKNKKTNKKKSERKKKKTMSTSSLHGTCEQNDYCKRHTFAFAAAVAEKKLKIVQCYICDRNIHACCSETQPSFQGYHICHEYHNNCRRTGYISEDTESEIAHTRNEYAEKDNAFDYSGIESEADIASFPSPSASSESDRQIIESEQVAHTSYDGDLDIPSYASSSASLESDRDQDYSDLDQVNDMITLLGELGVGKSRIGARETTENFIIRERPYINKDGKLFKALKRTIDKLHDTEAYDTPLGVYVTPDGNMMEGNEKYHTPMNESEEDFKTRLGLETPSYKDTYDPDIDLFRINIEIKWNDATTTTREKIIEEERMFRRVCNDDFWMLFGFTTRIQLHARTTPVFTLRRKVSIEKPKEDDNADGNRTQQQDLEYLDKMQKLHKKFPYVDLANVGDEFLVCRDPVEIAILRKDVDNYIHALNTISSYHVTKRSGWEKSHIILEPCSVQNNSPTLFIIMKALFKARYVFMLCLYLYLYSIKHMFNNITYLYLFFHLIFCCGLE